MNWTYTTTVFMKHLCFSPCEECKTDFLAVVTLRITSYDAMKVSWLVKFFWWSNDYSLRAYKQLVRPLFECVTCENMFTVFKLRVAGSVLVMQNTKLNQIKFSAASVSMCNMWKCVCSYWNLGKHLGNLHGARSSNLYQCDTCKSRSEFWMPRMWLQNQWLLRVEFTQQQCAWSIYMFFLVKGVKQIF